ncbi:hypothetical protein L210DRAFT_2069171 [Boletus edulis BED1]|uniref:Uncharacterized protein n=1 Tax=Boletus edulis BED1 TaxID=1328754 RepID=A0AAD4BW51_BOLED|nr:hypothetical protein L210DRAFT_2069171 [Boletus edulis BED1]
MNNCRAGLYSFASTTAWLHKIGVASPPLLVMLGLTLPDSRILSGIASIGLTLANIAIILPHLRQPILDSIHPHEQSTKEQTNLSPDRSNATQPVELDAERLVLAPVLPSEREHQSPPLTCSATLKSVRSADTELLGYPNVEPEAAPQTMLLPPAEKTDDNQTSPHTSHSPDADSSDRHVSSNHLFTREGRSALYTPLPVPDAEEIAFFDTENATLSNNDPGEECSAAACEWHTVPGGHPTIEYCGLKDGKLQTFQAHKGMLK